MGHAMLSLGHDMGIYWEYTSERTIEERASQTKQKGGLSSSLALPQPHM